MSKNHKRSAQSRIAIKKILWQILFKGKKEGKCCICGEVLFFNESTIEHVVPMGAGGKDVIENMNVAHNKCNHKKGKNYDILRCADHMAKKLFDMCKGKREVVSRWKTLVDSIKKEPGTVTLEKCKEAYLKRKGVK